MKHEGDGRIFKINVNLDYNTVRMLGYHISVNPVTSSAGRRNILRVMEPKDSFPFKDHLCPGQQFPDDEDRCSP